MTQPRYIAPGETVFMTVRTVARFYLLRPDPELVEAIKYCLAHYAEKHDMILHAVCVMSTHMHLIAFDEAGNRSLFLRDVNRGIANVVKAMRGWRGPVFRPKPNVVRLLTREAIVDKIAYTVTNPVAAGAVRRFTEWPGLCAAGGLTSTLQSASRPSHFFSDKGDLPPLAKLRLELPSELASSEGHERATQIIAKAIRAHERRAQEAVQERGWKVYGPRHCLKRSPYERARAYEVFGKTEPTFAVLGGGKSVYAQAVRQLRAFRLAYRAAWEQWSQGTRSAQFPFGTWLMRVQHGVCCQPPPCPSPC